MEDHLTNLSEKDELPLTKRNKTLFNNPALKQMIHDDQSQCNILTQKVFKSIVKNTDREVELINQQKLYEQKRKIQLICYKNVKLSQQVDALKKRLCHYRRNGFIISLSIGIGMFVLGLASGKAKSWLCFLQNKL